MTKLHDRPVRPRARSTRPSYPRKLSLGAVALLTAVAGTAMGCANLVETANGDEGSDDDLTWQDIDKPAWIQTPEEQDPDGEYAGGIGEEWVEEGGGGGDVGGGDVGGGDVGGAGVGGSYDYDS